MGSLSHPEFASLTDQITQLVSKIDAEEVINSNDETARIKALRAAQKLLIKLKKPGDLASEATSQVSPPLFRAVKGNVQRGGEAVGCF